MNVEHLPIITMNTDDMVHKGALGFMYKYMMRLDVKSITMVHLEGATGERRFLNRLTRHDDGLHWVHDSCVYRFLNVYGKLCGNDQAMVAWLRRGDERRAPG